MMRIMPEHNEHKENIIDTDYVKELPQRVLQTYACLWQFETWLRRMVYIELRAFCGDDWVSMISNYDRSREGDKRLTHMPTPEGDPLSYTPFSEIKKIISAHWELFSTYFPPKNIWEAKLEEVSQVRNRVAHFRRGHSDDLQRVVQLLRDIDQGFWMFCTSFNDSRPILPPSKDCVTKKFLDLDPFPFTEVEENKWARVGSADPSVPLAVTIETLKRPWADPTDNIDGYKGYIYEINILARNQRTFDYRKFLESTKRIHDRLVHICLDSFANSVRITLPSVLGAKTVIEIIKEFIEISRCYIFPGRSLGLNDDSVQRLSEEWPEYVLGPENPLTFLAPDMPCTFFGV